MNKAVKYASSGQLILHLCDLSVSVCTNEKHCYTEKNFNVLDATVFEGFNRKSSS